MGHCAAVNDVHTWAHKAGRSTARRRHLARGRKTKVRDENFNVSAQGGDENVFRLQITVVDSTAVAEIKRVDDLDQDVLDQLVLSEERELLDDGVKVAGAEVVDEVGIRARVDLTMECEYIGVVRNSRMEAGFTTLAVV